MGTRVTAAVVLLLSVVLLGWALAPSNRRHAPIPFDSVRWKQERTGFTSEIRQGMAADLIQSRWLIGLSRSDVVMQLGNSDVDYREPRPSLYYEIRIHYGWDIDPISGTYFVIDFGPDDNVSNIRTEDWN
jgi:hypothetical protein